MIFFPVLKSIYDSVKEPVARPVPVVSGILNRLKYEVTIEELSNTITP